MMCVIDEINKGRKWRPYREFILFDIIIEILMKYRNKWGNFQYSGMDVDHASLRNVFRVTRTNGDTITFIVCPRKNMFAVSLMVIDDDDHVTRYPVVYFDMPFSACPYTLDRVAKISDPNQWMQHAVRVITSILELFQTTTNSLATFIKHTLEVVGDLDSTDKLVIKLSQDQNDGTYHFTAEVKSKKQKKLTEKSYADAFFNASQPNSNKE